MKRINNAKEFLQLVAQAKTHFLTDLTNFTLLSPELCVCIEQGNLFWEAYAHGIWFFERNQQTYRLYFFCRSEYPAALMQKELPVLAGTVYLTHKLQHIQAVQKVLRCCGFSAYKNNLQMSKKNMQPNMASLPHGFSAKRATAAQQEEIETLWSEWLDPISAPYPQGKKLLCEIEQGNLFCVLDRSKAVAACMQMQTNKATCTVSHVVVSPMYRQKGLATAQICAALEEMNFQTVLLWVNEGNSAARALYQKLGFEYTGKASMQLMLPKTEE